ncbi:MAG: hypothetical protein JWR30_3072 [Conexibacter sp.]|jgi:hypothetical protein|nr:hypothetical protein [Conexibacter sp.]MCZ4493634.1 hypothetical protein [Conexibacter sp.]MDX6716561.1 uncharacterized protein [Baekduia sp.]
MSPLVVVADMLNERELHRYVQRVDGRWPLERVILGGARVLDAQGAPPQRERGSEYVAILISEYFAGVPWLERVYQAGNLWDASEMGGTVDVHCYTPGEFERKRDTLPVVRQVAAHGIELVDAPPPQN